MSRPFFGIIRGTNAPLHPTFVVRSQNRFDLVVEGKIVAKALDGQRYPLPLDMSLCGCEVVRGAAALKGPMTYAVFI